MNKRISIIALAAMLSCLFSNAFAVTFDPSVRYSKEVINARMTSWKNKSTAVGFPNANSTNGSTSAVKAADWDYVPGVVAKGILDVWAYYQDSTWADAWFISLRDWARSKTAKNTGGSLDDLNCTKVYFGIYDGCKVGGKFENSDTASYCITQMGRGATGLAAHKSSYSISGTSSTADGGWYHKSSYTKQMWCDGAYMGPALLAQIIAYDGLGGVSLGWSDVMTQMTAAWGGLWDDTNKLLWHCFSTDKSSGGASGWVYADAQPKIGGGYHSAEYWSRANGWFIMALVDEMEAMEKVGKTAGDSDFDTLHGYLNKLAAGLVARQDETTGCWYQLLQYDDSKCAKQGTDATGSGSYTNASSGGTFCNYLESSGSCLITAALLKGSRLGYYDYWEEGKKGYEGIVDQFLTGTTGTYQVTKSCESAGLGSDRNGSAAYYLIGRDVGINNGSEGKALGPFLMAAVEYERKYMAPEECDCLKITVE